MQGMNSLSMGAKSYVFTRVNTPQFVCNLLQWAQTFSVSDRFPFNARTNSMLTNLTY